MRLFIAIDLADAVRARVGEVLERERQRLEARWSQLDRLHLTLVFLGETPAERVAPIVDACRAVAARHPRLTLAFQGAGTFGSPARVLWLGVQGPERLQALAAELRSALGLPAADDHQPHLTLARSRSGRGDPRLGEVAARLASQRLGPWEVDHLTVYESADGQYRVLGVAPLGVEPQR